MAILAFQKPDKVIMLEESSTYGKFEFRPLEPGFGTTIGNALRRILLSSLEGFAINTVKIEGVEHEFSTVPGVREDVTNIILNLKQVRFKHLINEFDNEKVCLKTLFRKIELNICDVKKYTCSRYRKSEFYQFDLFINDKKILINTRYKDEFEKVLKDYKIEQTIK